MTKFAFIPLLLFRRTDCIGCSRPATKREEASRRRALARTGYKVIAAFPGFGELERHHQVIEVAWACPLCRRQIQAACVLLGTRRPVGDVWTKTMKRIDRRFGGALRRGGLSLVKRVGPVAASDVILSK